MTYGIGRVPADVDPMDELRAELEAERLQPTPPPPKDRKLIRCKRCGQTGYAGEYPFSTLGGHPICDDCL